MTRKRYEQTTRAFAELEERSSHEYQPVSFGAVLVFVLLAAGFGFGAGTAAKDERLGVIVGSVLGLLTMVPTGAAWITQRQLSDVTRWYRQPDELPDPPRRAFVPSRDGQARTWRVENMLFTQSQREQVYQRITANGDRMTRRCWRGVIGANEDYTPILAWMKETGLVDDGGILTAQGHEYFRGSYDA